MMVSIREDRLGRPAMGFPGGGYDASGVSDSGRAAVSGAREPDPAPQRAVARFEWLVRTIPVSGSDGGAHAALLALRSGREEQPVSDGAAGNQRRVQRGRDGVERRRGSDGASGGRGPEIVLRVAESANGIEGFRFWDYPVAMPEGADPETNVYDMRLVAHQDGWIYGLFCAERKDPAAPPATCRARWPSAASRAHGT